MTAAARIAAWLRAAILVPPYVPPPPEPGRDPWLDFRVD